MDIFEKICAILAEQLEIDADKILPESDLAKDLEADSLDKVGIIMDIEQTFDIEIGDEELPKVVTVQDIVDYVQQAKK